MRDINAVIKRVLEEPEQAKLLMEEFDKDPDFFEDECYNTVDKETLNGFLDLVLKNQKTSARLLNREILIPLLSCLLWDSVDEKSIDNTAYEKIKLLEMEYSYGLLCAIAHYPIAVYQLMEINSMANRSMLKAGCTEAFAQLLCLFCKNDCFTANDLTKLLEETVTPLQITEAAYYNLKDEIRDINKINILENYLFHKDQQI